MAVGETASGKSTSLMLVRKLLGGTLISQSSGESVMSELVKSSFPVYWDDPAHPNTLKKVLVSTFQGGGKQTKGGGNELPLTTFVMTVNFTLDEDMRLYILFCTWDSTQRLFNETFPCRAVSNWKWRKSVHVSMSFHKHPNTMSSSRYSSTKTCKSKMKKLTQFNHIHFYRINRSFSQWTDEKQFNTMKTNVKHIFRSLSYSFVDIHLWFCRVMLLLKG